MIEDKDSLPQLAAGWVWASIGEFCQVLGGKRLPKGHKFSELPTKHPYIRVTDFDRMTINTEGLRYLKTETHELIQKYTISKDDVYISIAGSIGKVGIIPESLDGANLTENAAKITSVEGTNNKALCYVLHAPFAQEQIKKSIVSTNQPKLALFRIKRIIVPIPPINEQGRIVDKIEELFTRLDAGVDSLKKIRTQLKRYRQAVLKHAFEGKLTEEWRKVHKHEIEPASVLLERTREERKKKEKGKYKELPPVDTTDLPELPESWMWTRLGDIVFLSSERFDPLISENERFVGLKNIERSTGKLLGFGKSSETRSTKTRFRKGDLLYGKLRPYLNKVWVADFDGVCSTDILVFLKHDFIDNKYLSTILLNNNFVEYAAQRMTGVQHPRINFRFLSKYVLPLPSLSEQYTIAVEIERRFSVADEIEKVIEQTLSQSEQLRQSILKKAFEGRLVPQDPNDEPAKKLLQRIREEKEKFMSGEQRKKKSNRERGLKQLELVRYVK